MDSKGERSHGKNRTHFLLTRQQIVLFSVASLTGVASGLAAVLLRLSIVGMTNLLSAIPRTIGLVGWVIMPVVGALASGILTTRFAQETSGHGIPDVMEAYTLREGRIRPRVPLLKTVTAALTIGSGGSGGQEGPIAQIGSGAGSYLAQLLKLDSRDMRTLVVCGTSSGIAAIFGAPLGGSLFGIEILVGELTAISVIPVILASVVSVAVSSALLGPNISPFAAPPFALTSYLELLFYLVMGLAFGLFGKAWVKVFHGIEDLFAKLRVSRWFKPAIGATLVGLLSIPVIALEFLFGYSGVFAEGSSYVPAIMGDGYAFVNSALLGQATWIALLAFGVLKMISTSLSIGSGGSGGIFAPTLYIGAGLGGAFGYLMSWLVPSVVTQPEAYALVGMAAMFAGAAHVPITCIVIIMEVTGGYGMILPLMIAVSSSYVVGSAVMPDSIYTMSLRKRGVTLRRGIYIDALRSVRVDQAMTANPVILSPDMTASEALRIVATTHHTRFPVVDRDGHVVGVMVAEVLEEHLDETGREITVERLMARDFLRVTSGTTMDEVLHMMTLEREGQAVVTSPSNPERMLGFVTKTDVLRAYEAGTTALKLSGRLSSDYSLGEEDIT